VEPETPARDADAERWRWFRQFLSVETDNFGATEFLFVNDSPDVIVDAAEHTVESLVDIARAARPLAEGQP
jgi:hypothetical protein